MPLCISVRGRTIRPCTCNDVKHMGSLLYAFIPHPARTRIISTSVLWRSNDSFLAPRLPALLYSEGGKMDPTPTRSHVDTGISDSQADDLYRRAVENDIRDYAIFLTDTASRVINWNRGAERILGYKESEVIGQSAFIFFTPEDRAARAPEREMDVAVATGRAEDERWH